jgi:hypothetical protein
VGYGGEPHFPTGIKDYFLTAYHIAQINWPTTIESNIIGLLVKVDNFDN